MAYYIVGKSVTQLSFARALHGFQTTLDQDEQINLSQQWTERRIFSDSELMAAVDAGTALLQYTGPGDGTNETAPAVDDLSVAITSAGSPLQP